MISTAAYRVRKSTSTRRLRWPRSELRSHQMRHAATLWNWLQDLPVQILSGNCISQKPSHFAVKHVQNLSEYLDYLRSAVPRPLQMVTVIREYFGQNSAVMVGKWEWLETNRRYFLELHIVFFHNLFWEFVSLSLNSSSLYIEIMAGQDEYSNFDDNETKICGYAAKPL